MPKRFIVILLILISAFSCSKKMNMDQELKDLNTLAENINDDLKSVRADIIKFANILQYKVPFHDTAKWDPEIYNTSNNILFRNKEDSRSAVYYPIANTIANKLKHIIINSEQLDSYFINILQNNSILEQVYFLDTNSFLRIYPYIDVLNQIKNPMKLTRFIPFQNTMGQPFNDSKAYWVNKPFADPYGRGWVISCSEPIYYRDEFIGIVSGDISLKTIQNKYLQSNTEKYILINDEGCLIYSTKEALDFIGVTPLREFHYYKPVTENIFIFDKPSLVEHKNKKLGNAIKLLLSGESKTSFLSGKKKYTIYKSQIKEVNWFLLKIIN